MDLAARDMAKVYSRNIAQKQLFVSNFAQRAFRENTSIESTVAGAPAFSAGQGPGETSLEIELRGPKPDEWALNILKKTGSVDVSEKDRRASRLSSRKIFILFFVHPG